MRKVLGIATFILTIAFVGALFAWNLAMNCVGLLLCAITSGGK